MKQESKRRIGLLVGLAGVVTVTLLLRWCGSESPTSTGPTRATAGPGGKISFDPSLRPPAPRLPEGKIPPVQQLGDPEPPIIDEILVEKPEVCAGEENLITVKAHAPDPRDDAYLKYLIGPDSGQQVAIRSYARDPEAGDHARKITVYGRLGAATTVDMPSFVVKDCSPERNLFILSRNLPNAPDEYEFFAKIIDVTATQQMQPPFRFHWDFGDGTTGDTDSALVHHSYEDRPENTLVSQFLITCEVTDARGERLVGRRGFQVDNSSFEQMAFKGLIFIRTLNTPRFPSLDDRGRVVQKVKLWHDHDQPVQIEEIYRIRYPEGGVEPRPEKLTGMAVLGTNLLGPGQKLEIEVEFDTLEHDDIAFVSYQLRGRSSDGWPAHGDFSVMKPPELPTRERNTPVTDPLLAAKILKARELLDQEYVSQEDLWRLERTGAFEGLEPVPNLTTSGEPPPPPKPPRE